MMSVIHNIHPVKQESWAWTTSLLFLQILLILLHCPVWEDTTNVARPAAKSKLKVLTFATKINVNVNRYEMSGSRHHLSVKILGLGQNWLGWRSDETGGAQKIVALRDELQNGDYEDDDIILFTDAFDVLLLADAEEILTQFHLANARVLFGAESSIWPDASLADQFPVVTEKARFLNSGGFIGYKGTLLKLINDLKLKPEDDDQLAYMKLYLDEDIRVENYIKLDHKSRIFFNLHNATMEVKLIQDEKGDYLQNTLFDTKILILHGNGPCYVKDWLKFFANLVGLLDKESIAIFSDRLERITYIYNIVHNPDTTVQKDVNNFLVFYCGTFMLMLLIVGILAVRIITDDMKSM